MKAQCTSDRAQRYPQGMMFSETVRHQTATQSLKQGWQRWDALDDAVLWLMWSPARCKMRGCLPNSGTLGLSAPTFFGGSWGFHGNDCWRTATNDTAVGLKFERTLPQAKQ
jgi:hypothetical protein